LFTCHLLYTTWWILCCGVYICWSCKSSVVGTWMSCVGSSSDLLYTKYVNPVYVTAITSPAAGQSLSTLSSGLPSTSRLGADCMSQISSARSHRHRTEFPYVVWRTATSGHRPPPATGVNSVIKSLQKLKFSHIGDDLVSDARTAILRSQAVDSGIHAGDWSRPSSRDDLEMSRSSLDLEMLVLDIGESDSSVIGEKSLGSAWLVMSSCRLIVYHAFSIVTFRVSRRWCEILVTHFCLSVYLSVRCRRCRIAKLPRTQMKVGVMVRGAPSCSLLGRFAVGAWVSLL